MVFSWWQAQLCSLLCTCLVIKPRWRIWKTNNLRRHLFYLEDGWFSVQLGLANKFGTITIDQMTEKLNTDTQTPEGTNSFNLKQGTAGRQRNREAPSSDYCGIIAGWIENGQIGLHSPWSQPRRINRYEKDINALVMLAINLTSPIPRTHGSCNYLYWHSCINRYCVRSVWGERPTSSSEETLDTDPPKKYSSNPYRKHSGKPSVKWKWRRYSLQVEKKS